MKWSLLFIVVVACASYAQTSPPSLRASNATSVYNKARDSVVFIQTKDGTQGSGVAAKVLPEELRKSDIYFYTNAHVVSEAAEVTARVGNQSVQLKPLLVSDRFDVAVFRAPRSSVPFKISEAPVQLVKAEVGAAVFAIGAPLGLERTLTEGIVSGHRDFRGLELIQTTAPISPGSSGGGLFGLDGRLLGITTFKLTKGESLNFAVPFDTIATLHEFAEAALGCLHTANQTFTVRELSAVVEQLYLDRTVRETAFHKNLEACKRFYTSQQGSPEWNSAASEVVRTAEQSLRDIRAKIASERESGPKGTAAAEPLRLGCAGVVEQSSLFGDVPTKREHARVFITVDLSTGIGVVDNAVFLVDLGGGYGRKERKFIVSDNELKWTASNENVGQVGLTLSSLTINRRTGELVWYESATSVDSEKKRMYHYTKNGSMQCERAADRKF